MESKFRLQSSKLFLTYPQCPIAAEDVLSQLKEKVSPIEVHEYIIAVETHKDGQPHVHCYLELSKKTNYKNANKLDLSSNDISYHGNY